MKPNLQIKIEIAETYLDTRSYRISVKIINGLLQTTTIEKYSLSIYYDDVPNFVCGYIIIKKQFKEFVEELGLDFNKFLELRLGLDNTFNALDMYICSETL